MNRAIKLLAAAALAGLASLAAFAGGSSAATATKAGLVPGCTPATNIEAIIDDSGSMDFNDPSKLRTAILDNLTGISAMSGKTIGGVEFGDTPDVLWAPASIPAVRPAMEASFSLVNADNGGTDYQDAFTLANTSNPGADARIFLSDGEPNEGTVPPTSQLTPSIKTYVIGLGTDISSDPDAVNILNSIASGTGGPAPLLAPDASSLIPISGALAAELTCHNPPLTFTDSFATAGQTFTHVFKATGKTADINVAWPTPGDQLAISLAGGNAHKATIAKTKIKVTASGQTFSSVHVKGLKKKQKVKVRVKAKVLPLPTTGTTQIIQ